MDTATALSSTDTYPAYKKNFFTFDDLRDVIDGKSAAIRVPEFCSKQICHDVSSCLLTHPKRGAFNKASEVNRVGMAHFEIDGPEANEKYHQTAISNILDMRNIFSPYLSPVDKLRLLLEEVWPAGANLESLYGKKCFVGICRIMDPAVELLAHNDRLDRDSPDSMQAHSLITQLSAAIYLKVPDEGRDLRLWMREPVSEAEYTNLKGGSHGITMDKLEAPACVIKPEEGELIIFNIRNLHGVSPGKGKQRINIGAFIGYRGINQPLSYWS